MNRRGIGLNIGGSSILVIFVLLCLTTFATLSTVSANADYKLAAKAAQTSSEYYAADALAEERLGEIAAILRSGSGANTTEYWNGIDAALSGLEGVYFSPYDDPPVVHFTIPVNDTQALSVSLALFYPTASDASRYTVTRWKVENIAPLEVIGDGLELWSGTWDD